MNFPESLDYLYSLGHETLAMKFGLRNTEILLAAFDNPQNDFVKIQIAGTNGKGSVCAFLDAILRAADIRAGSFTSPHLVSINERIRIAGVDISDEKFAALTAQVKERAEKLVAEQKLETLPTFFEHLTVIGLLAFREAKVAVAVLETGLGGRLDSVTAARAEIVGITQIALDHQEYLGDTLAQIAAEKAAVIRRDNRVVARPGHESTKAILKRCSEVGNYAPIMYLSSYRKVKSASEGKIEATFCSNFRLKTLYENVRLGLRGRHQLENAALTINIAEVLREFDFDISHEAIIHGLETARHAGRLEFVDGLLFDGAHNAAGAKALREFLLEFHPRQKITMIFGAMRDKNLREIAAELFPLAENLILTRADNPRSAAPQDLREIAAPFARNIKIAPTVGEALELARELVAPADLICATGSLYLVGEARHVLRAAD